DGCASASTSAPSGLMRCSSIRATTGPKPSFSSPEGGLTVIRRRSPDLGMVADVHTRGPGCDDGMGADDRILEHGAGNVRLAEDDAVADDAVLDAGVAFDGHVRAEHR